MFDQQQEALNDDLAGRYDYQRELIEEHRDRCDVWDESDDTFYNELADHADQEREELDYQNAAVSDFQVAMSQDMHDPHEFDQYDTDEYLTACALETEELETRIDMGWENAANNNEWVQPNRPPMRYYKLNFDEIPF